MNERESKTVTVEQPYGPYYAELTADIPMENAPAGLKKGDKVKLGNGMNAWIKNVDQVKQVVTIDANAPFAGRTVSVKVAVEVRAHVCTHMTLVSSSVHIAYQYRPHHTNTPQAVESLESGRFESVHLAAGCFWGLELAMQRTRGVVGTAVGYTQGQKESPSYSEVCSGTTGHTEACEVIYDPTEIKFEELLEVFWNRHNPTQLNRQGNDVGTQYRGGIYTTSEAQRAAAEASKAAYVLGWLIWRSCCGRVVSRLRHGFDILTYIGWRPRASTKTP